MMQPVTVFMVAEKPSIARTIARILSDGKCVSHTVGGCEVHEYIGTFQKTPAKFKVSSTFGHVFTIDFPAAFNNWEKVDPSTLFDAPVIRREADPKKHVPDKLARAAAGANHLVLWLDWDREGENICFEVIDCVAPRMSPHPHASGREGTKKPAMAGPYQQIWRAKFSSLADVDIKRVMNALKSPNKNESDSVECRQELDLKLGCAFTRYLTQYFREKYDARLISYGPCQMPTLFFCVERADTIATFQPETFYYIDIYTKDDNSPLVWSRDRIFSEIVTRCFVDQFEEAQYATCVDIIVSQKRKVRPAALHTIAMLKAASSQLGLSPHDAMVHAENLYTSGLISYPRTETTSYPKNFDFQQTLMVLARSVGEFANLASSFLTRGITKPREGADAGDHPPITPTRAATREDCGSHDAWRLYQYIARHFLASLSGDCIFEQTQHVYRINNERFTQTGRRVIDPGYTSILGSEMVDRDICLNKNVKINHNYPIARVEMKSGKTSAPDHLSETELLDLMEKNGIGTDASMAVHIKNIGTRGYVALTPGRKLVPTELGLPLIHGYMEIDAELVLPKVRSAIEAQCDKVAKGEAKKDDVVKRCLALFALKFDFFKKNINRMDIMLEATCTTAAQAAEPFSACGECNRYMKLTKTRPPRLFCGNCNKTYSLPSNGVIKLYGGLKCPIDKFELVLCSTGAASAGGQTFSVCPACYNDPPFESLGGPAHKTQGAPLNTAMTCSQCPHPTCKHSRIARGVCLCENDNCPGVVCLDVNSHPRWRFDCNTCNFQLNLVDKIHKVTVHSEERCPQCASAYVNIEYHKDFVHSDGTKPKTPSIRGCILCNGEITDLFASRAARTHMKRRTPIVGRRGGRRGGPRGR